MLHVARHRYTQKYQILPFAEFLNLLEGNDVEVRMPRNTVGEDFTFSARTPIFFSGPHPLQVIENGVFLRSETAMLDSRIRYFHFTRPIPNPQPELSLIKCPNCFARLLLGTPAP